MTDAGRSGNSSGRIVAAASPVVRGAVVLGLVLLGLGVVIFVRSRHSAESAPGAVPGLSASDVSTTEPAPSWPFLRGTNYDGHSSETGLAETWPSEGPPVLWSRPLGQGYSAFVARDDRAYTQYQSLGGQYVVCLDADSGETVWEYRYDWPYEAAEVYPGPRSSPTLDGRFVYFTTPAGVVGCLSEGGKLVWSVDFLKRFEGRGADFGYSCSPVVVDGRVLLPAGGAGAAMVALDARDGSTLWQAGDDSASYTPALPICVDGHRQVIGYLENVLTAFDFESGRLLWRSEVSQGYDEHAAWPIFVEPHLWISSPFRSGSQLLKLSGGAGASQETVWRSKLLSNDVCSSVHHEGLVYGFDLKDVQAKTHSPSRGSFRCLELETGAQRWATDRVGHSSVLVADGKLILFCDTGELILARANSEQYEELARTAVFSGEVSWTPPALHRGRVYLRTHSQAACLYLGKPGRLAAERRGPALTVADIPRHSDFRWESLLGVEPEYAFDLPSPLWLWNWFVACLGVLALAGLLTRGLMATAARWPLREIRRPWPLFWTLSFVLGAAATTPLSVWRGEFTFTWPVPLFVVFQATIHQVRLKRVDAGENRARWKERGVVLLFLAVCVAYYLLCRRLSLVFEWGFLFGFGAAVPFALFERWLSRHARWGWLAPLVFTPLGFAAYYWASMGILYGHYHLTTGP